MLTWRSETRSARITSMRHLTRRPAAKQSFPMNEVTRILEAIDQGDPHAAEQLLPLVYDELRKLAAQRLAQEKPGQTLQATALVHEAYLRLVGDRPCRVGQSAATSSAPRLKPCGGSWSSKPGGSAASGTAEHSTVSISMKPAPLCSPRATTCWPSMKL